MENVRVFTVEEKINLSNIICDELRSASGNIYTNYLLKPNENEISINTRDLTEIIFNGLSKLILFTVESINSEFGKSADDISNKILLSVFIQGLLKLHDMKNDFVEGNNQKH